MDSGVLIIMPAYNEGARIAEVVKGVRAAAPHAVLVIDDGSSDDTAEQARGAGAVVVSQIGRAHV